MVSRRKYQSLVLAACMVLVSAVAHAQATRTWVSGVGDDANPCSRTAPCKTFAGAISKTAAGGIIDALDPGGYGAVTITKAMTIEGTGTLASALSSGVQGVIVNITSGTNRNVVLRDIAIDGAGVTLGTNGINFLAGDSLTLERVSIKQYSTNGIFFQPNSAASLNLNNVSILLCATGIRSAPVVGGSSKIHVENTLIAKGATGVIAGASTGGEISNSIISNNSGDGLQASGGAVMVIASSRVFNNGGSGLNTNASTIAASNTDIIANGTGLSNSGGTLNTFGRNRVAFNGSPGVAFNLPALPES
jgi:hypothetical protein